MPDFFGIFINIVKNNPWMFITIIGVLIIYAVLNRISKKKHDDFQVKTDIDYDDQIYSQEKTRHIKTASAVETEDKSERIKNGYSKKQSSYVSAARDYGYIPSDGSRIRGGQTKSQKTYGKKQNLNSKMQALETVYKLTLYKDQETSISTAARKTKLSNDEFIYYLRQFNKKGLFLDVKLDELNGEIKYPTAIDEVDQF